MVAVLSWSTVDGCYYFLVGPGRLLLFSCSARPLMFRAALWRVPGISCRAMDGCRYFLMASG